MKLFLLLITVFIVISSVYGKNEKFDYKDNTYSYSFTFSTNHHKSIILAVLYEFDHLKKYSSGISRVRYLGESGENSYMVEICLEHLFYADKSVYKRTIFPADGLIKIELKEFKANSSLFPSVTRSCSEYKVFDNGEKTTVLYRQTVSFNKGLNRVYLKIIKNRLDRFADDLIGYVARQEN
ncbi:MAG: hypothetical protein Q4F84_03305 [Fibrobacter sp.]|nr:hypothetical protein [Fibrobacter sp.]